VNGEADPDTGGLIRQSRKGDLAALGRLLDTYRNYLTLLARLHIGQELQGKISASDVVQETCLQAHRSIGQFRGSTEAELLRWLRSIHASKLANLMRHYLGTQQRNLQRERRLEGDLDRSSSALAAVLARSDSSPSQRAMRREQSVVLADALEQLPDDYRQVILLHHVKGLNMGEVSRQLGTSRYEVEKLWMRALAALRRAMGDIEHASAK
jgi:RNA polymerase sigma-70 factor (ECF subfamily)